MKLCNHLWAVLCVGIVLFAIGCGGGSSSNPNLTPTPFQATFTSGNWTIFLPPGLPPSQFGQPPVFSGFPLNIPFAGGQLTQSGNTISGSLFVSGLSCFDPVADRLTVNGTFDPKSTALSFSTMPVRGQVLMFSGAETFVPQSLPCDTPFCHGAPPSPVEVIGGTITISGGTCAGTATSSGFLTDFTGFTAFSTGATGNFGLQLAQTGPDAQGLFHVSGTVNPSTPCFASGTISSSAVAGELTQLTITTDTGQLSGMGQNVAYLDTLDELVTRKSLIFTMHGGPCDGQTFGQ